MSQRVADAEITLRPLAAADLAAVVAIDAVAEGRTRREYVERRLRAAMREPTLHAQFAADDASGLAGFILARVLAGEFGRTSPALRLELMGVRADRHEAGIGRRLFAALSAWALRHGIDEVRTAASWRETPILGWFDALGFELSGERIVECTVEAAAFDARDAAAQDAAVLPEAHAEIDYGRHDAEGANDHERLARDRADVRSMTAADLDAIVRIDRDITGSERRAYIESRFAEAMGDAGVRVSLAARCEGAVVGYLMARADLGDFGRTEAVAVLDTIGVDPAYAHRGIGRALLSQLFANLGALHVERVETVVGAHDIALLRFLDAAGFVPGQRLPFVKRLTQ
jgi:predicted N-acetyltransferase YhbS